MSDLETKSVELLDKLDALATQYTPNVIDGAVAAIQITAIGNLIWGVVGIMCAIIFWWLSTRFTMYARTKKQDGGYMSNWEIGIVIGMGSGIFITGFIALINIAALFNIWNWVAIYNPELAMAHRILGL